MDRREDVLQQIARIARSSRDFFVAVYPGVNDAEIRTAFAYIGEVKTQLLADLAPWVPQTEPDQADPISPAAIVAKMYTDAHKAFRHNVPAASASALSFGEEQLLRLLERAFEESCVPALNEVLKSYHPQLVICREAMWRLHARQAA